VRLAPISELAHQANEVPTIVRDEDPPHPRCTSELIDVGETTRRKLDSRIDRKTASA
jgi:hypothetical protein